MKVGDILIVKNHEKINKSVRGCMVLVKKMEGDEDNPKIFMQVLEGDLKGRTVHTYKKDDYLLPLKNKGKEN